MLDKLQFLWSKTNRWHRVILIFLIVELRLIPGGQVGFTCNDPALSHPFTGDTVSFKWLLGITTLLPLATMLLVERKYNSDELSSQRTKQQALCWYKEYLYGVLINLTTVQTLKLIVGSPRPHFFDTCRPQEAMTCEGSEYISSYSCTKAHWLSQSDKSFPSGHTSLALHAGFFIAYYLHQRMRCRPNSRAVLATQLACTASAVYCAVSRMMDHRHHWWDVLAGAAIAVPVLFYTIYSLCGNFECDIASNDKDKENNISENGNSNVSHNTRSIEGAT